MAAPFAEKRNRPRIPLMHKTVFVLDHSPQFRRSCNQSIEYDTILGKGKTQGIPAAPIYKTLWTCSVETIMEYIRIVYDIHPSDKLIKVVTGIQALNSWSEKEQNLQHLMTALSFVGPPPETSDEYNIVHGLQQAVEELCHPSDAQKIKEAEDGDVDNKGRIICVTYARSDAQIHMLKECVIGALEQHNNLAAEAPQLQPVTHCELVLIHIVPIGEEMKVTERESHQVSPLLTCEVHVTESGQEQYNKLIQLAYIHYNLTSTTVTGIPMKEEQNASSSANYDVELLHPVEAHEELLRSAAGDGLMIQSKEGLPINTITLKWCTPKSNVLDLPVSAGAYRITPVDVNSRPSSCLTNFLLSGRAVMLEQPKKTGVKVVSHMLASHGGEIFIHCIPTNRSILEDPPSISEGLGGRVTDYRIPDFREFMKENRLAPASPAVAELSAQLPITRALDHVERTSRFWPMVISDTLIFNMASHVDPLPTLLVKETLTEEDVSECRKAIYHIAGMENRNENLPISVAGTRGKGSKKEQQYTQMWSELESLVRAHADTSPMHKKVLEYLLECKKPSDEAKGRKQSSSSSSSTSAMKEDISEVESAWKDLDRYQKMTTQEKKEFNRMDSADDSGPPSKRLRSDPVGPLVRTGDNQSLWDIYQDMRQKKCRNRVEFAGRRENPGVIAPLYKHMFKDEPTDPNDPNTKK